MQITAGVGMYKNPSLPASLNQLALVARQPPREPITFTDKVDLRLNFLR